MRRSRGVAQLCTNNRSLSESLQGESNTIDYLRESFSSISNVYFCAHQMLIHSSQAEIPAALKLNTAIKWHRFPISLSGIALRTADWSGLRRRSVFAWSGVGRQKCILFFKLQLSNSVKMEAKNRNPDTRDNWTEVFNLPPNQRIAEGAKNK